MKRTAHLLLLLPVILHAGGIMLICLLLQLNVKQELQAVLKNPITRFEMLSLTLDEFNKAKIDKYEILLDGKIFDLKEIRFYKNHVELLAFHDTKEEGLISVIENLFSPENSKKEFNIQVFKLLASVFTFEKHVLTFADPAFSESFGSPLQDCYHSFSEDIFSPPPEG